MRCGVFVVNGRYACLMWTYEIVFDEGDVPPLRDLGEPTIGPRDAHGKTFFLMFPSDYALDLPMRARVEAVVGRTCTVVRTDEAGALQSCGGAIDSVLRVHMNGVGFQPTA